MKKTPALLTLAASVALAAGVAGAGLMRSAPAAPAAERAVAESHQARIIAAKFHADWCGWCKAMGPVFEELGAKFDQEPVLYVEFDQTREFDRRQSAYLANALALEGVWKEHGGATGFVLLIDATTKQVVHRLSYDQSLKEMGDALQDAVRNAASPAGDHPKGDHPKGDHPKGDHPKGDHPAGDHPAGDHPKGDHPKSDHPR